MEESKYFGCVGVLEKVWPIRGMESGQGEGELVLVRLCSQLGKYPRGVTVMAPGGPDSSRFPCILAKELQSWSDGPILIGASQRRQ